MKKKKALKPFPQGRVVLDYETDGLSPYDGSRPFIAGLEDEAGRVIKARPGEADWNRVVKGIVEDPTIEKITHGGKFEIKMSRHYGMRPQGKFHDTMALAVLINEYQKLNLGWLSATHLGDRSKDIVKNWLTANARRIKKEKGREINYKDVPKWLIEKYLEGDLDKTLCLFYLWYKTVKKEHSDLYEMETDLVYDIADMEDHGIWIDVPYTREQIKIFRPMIEDLLNKMISMIGCKFNPGSGIQLTEVMEILKLDTGLRNKDGTMNTNEKVLTPLLPNEFISTLLEWRALRKLLGTYLVPFTQKAYGNVIHGNIWQYGRDKAIVTGRLSSSGPNLQNIPVKSKSIRRCIIPPPDSAMIFFDFNQIEMRIFTCLAGDPRAIKDLNNNIDPYVAQGKILLGKDAFNGISESEHKQRRSMAKELCLSKIYGIGIKALAQKMNMSVMETKQRSDAYFNNSPATKKFMIHTTRDLLVNGFVRDRFGRKYHVPRDNAYKAVNAICQGAAATIMKKSIIAARPLKDMGAKMMLTVHDELIVTAPIKQAKAIAREGKRLLESQSLPFEVPMRVGVDYSITNWSDKKKLEGL